MKYIYTFENEVKGLRKAMKGFGTDEDSIIKILTSVPADKRRVLIDDYEEHTNRDLIKDFKSELRGHFEDVVVASVIPRTDCFAIYLRNAMKGIGTDEKRINEIICILTNFGVGEVSNAYNRIYGRSLKDDLRSETSGDYQEFLISYIRGNFSDGDVNEDVEELYNAGEDKWGTDECAFIRIFTKRSSEHLRKVFKLYKERYGKSMKKVIKNEMSGDLKHVFIQLIKAVSNPSKYCAKKLYEAMDGMGTNDDMLILWITTVVAYGTYSDLEDVYLKMVGRTLEYDIKKETCGDYKTYLLKLI